MQTLLKGGTIIDSELLQKFRGSLEQFERTQVDLRKGLEEVFPSNEEKELKVIQHLL